MQRTAGPVFCLLYFIIGVSQYFGTTYVSLFLNSFDFIDGLAVGIIMAIHYLTGAVGQFLWGDLADCSRTKNRILSLVLAGIFASTWLLILPQHRSAGTLLLGVVCVNLFLLVPLSIFDTIVVENAASSKLPFGAMRSFSSAGSAFAAFALFLIGTLAAIRIQAKTGLAIMAFSALAALLPMRLVPKTAGHAYGQRSQRAKQVVELMKNRRFLLLLAFGLCNFACTGAYVSYFAIYFTSTLGLGGKLELLNLYAALCIAGESILIAVSGRLFQKKDIYWIFTWVSVMGAFRSLAAFLAPNPYILLAGGIFQGLMFGPLWGRTAPFIGSLVRDEVRATAQAVWSIVIQGIGPALGALIGGGVTRIVGLHGVFGIVVCMHLVTALAFLLPFRQQRQRERSVCAAAEKAQASDERK